MANPFFNQIYNIALRQTGNPELARLAAAQSSLETGYGKHVPGGNLFGIKSHGREGGGTFATAEVVDGRPVSTTASFRGYGSSEESVADWLDFLRTNPRYARAGLFEAKDAGEMADALQRAGYATDPDYASKLKSIMGVGPDVRMAAVGAGPGEISDVTDRTPTGDPITGRMDMSLPQFPTPRPAPVPPALDVDLEAFKPSPVAALADSLMMAGAMFGNRPTPLRGALGAGVMGGASDLELLQLKHRIAQSQYERERAIWENEQAAAQVAQQEHFLQQLPPAQQTLARAMGAEDYAKIHANQLADQQKMEAMLGAEQQMFEAEQRADQQKMEAMQDAFGPAGGAAYRVDPDLQQIMAGGVMGPDDVVKEQERRNRETESAIVATRKEFGKAADPAAFAIKTWEQSKDMPPPDQMNAIQDVQLVKAYSKMLLPEEAVMGQDTVTLASAGNSMLESMWKQVITGEGQLSEDQRKWIFEQMDGLAKDAAQEHMKTWNKYYDIAHNLPGLMRKPPEQRKKRITDIIGSTPAAYSPRATADSVVRKYNLPDPFDPLGP